MKFTKMQGLGNDYIYVNCLEEHVENPAELSRRISDRHFGAGSDGLVLILPGKEGDFRMRMFNADGSEAEMCGNATRCVAKYVRERRLTDKNEILLETGAGIKTLSLSMQGNQVQSVRVNMGKPELAPESIPVRLAGDRIVDREIEAEDRRWNVTCVSMGNPHAVIFVENAERFDVTGIGPGLETCSLFPEKTNVEFATVLNRNQIRMRVWERGSGETMACGTGACATVVAGILNGLCEHQTDVVLNGGVLKVSWDEETGEVWQEGPAEFVYDGVWPD